MNEELNEELKKEIKKDNDMLNEKMKRYLETAEKYTNEIMDLINHKDELTTSDLQGAVMGIVLSLISERK
jgi:hypothetical protein